MLIEQNQMVASVLKTRLQLWKMLQNLAAIDKNAVLDLQLFEDKYTFNGELIPKINIGNYPQGWRCLALEDSIM